MYIGIVLSKPPGYSETFFNSKIKGLIKNGNQVVLFCQKNDPKFDLCPVKIAPRKYKNVVYQFLNVLYVFSSVLFELKKVKRFYKLEKAQGTSELKIFKKIYLNSNFFKSNLDWVHFGFATLALERELIPKAIKAKLAVSFRGFDMAIYPVKNKNCYDLLWKHVDKVHTISDDLLKLAYDHGLPSNTPFKKITPAIDTAKFYSNICRMPDDNMPVNILTVARLHWKKGLIDTLEALHILKKKGISFKYRIIGEGDQYEELLFTIQQLDLNTDVILLGRCPHDEVKKLMQDSNLYLQYSISEGFCNAVLEAQAMGLLCIVSDAEGLSENVLSGETGLVVSKRSPIILAEAIQEVMHYSKDKKLELCQNAMRRVQSDFNLKNQSLAFHNFYNVTET